MILVHYLSPKYSLTKKQHLYIFDCQKIVGQVVAQLLKKSFVVFCLVDFHFCVVVFNVIDFHLIIMYLAFTVLHCL